MSVVSMKKLTLVALQKDRRKILKAFTKLGTTEVAMAEPYDNTSRGKNDAARDGIEKKLARLDFAFAFLKEVSRELAKDAKKLTKEEQNAKLAIPKLNFKRANELVDYDALTNFVTENEYELFSLISRLETNNSQLTDIKADKTRNNNLFADVAAYGGLDARFSEYKDTKRVTYFVGTVATASLDALSESLSPYDEIEVLRDDKTATIAIAAPIEEKEALQKTLAQCEFVRCPFSYDMTPKEAMADLSAKLAVLEENRVKLLADSSECFDELQDFMKLYDYYSLEKDKLDAIDNTVGTAKAFVMQAWLPANTEKITVDALRAASPTAVFEVTNPDKDDIVPAYLRDSKIVGSFGDSVTAMFGAPKRGEIDPNPFVAFFYFLFFGFMLSDAGYGLLLAIFCLAYIAIKKPVKNSGSFILMLGLCGISTLIWGTIFGGWFGIESVYLEQNAFGRFLLSLQLINPLEGSQALVMFGLALGLGVLQLGTGFFINGYQKIKQGNVLDGIFNDFCWVAIFIGAAVFLLDMLMHTGVINIIGIVILGLGVVMLLAGGCIGKKNPVKMFAGMFKNLYGSVNVFSDILSYARLFGLGLTTGVIGMVINKIGILFIDLVPYVGYVIAACIFIVGHLFNFGINALGVYVHNSRLQYVEFFGKFYSGEGHAFRPLGGKTKYIYLSDSLDVKPTKIKTTSK